MASFFVFVVKLYLNLLSMGMFSFFGDSEHRVFNYKPIYYNPEEEERKRRFGRVDGSLGNTASDESGKQSAKDTYVPGSYIKGAFKDGNYRSSRGHASKAQTIIGIVTMLLVFAVLYMIARFYMSL